MLIFQKELFGFILSINQQIQNFQYYCHDRNDISDDVCEIAQTRNVCIIDDLLQEGSDNKNVANLFTKMPHHTNLSIIFITQKFIFEGEKSRIIYKSQILMVLFKCT